MINDTPPPGRDRDALEHEVLLQLDASKTPCGSRWLRAQLGRRGFNLSEPTVGRFLSDLDERGHTTRVGYQGRTLTEAGRARLRQLEIIRAESESNAALLDSIRPSTLGELLELMIARRAIEREIARLAALNATDAHVAEIRAALADQQHALDGGSMAVPEDIRFHNTIGGACGNRVLRNTLAVIRRDEPLAYMMVRLR